MGFGAGRSRQPNPDSLFIGDLFAGGNELAGVRNLSLHHRTTTANPGELTQTTAFPEGDWDEISNDFARIELVNDTGDTVVLTDVVIRGEPVQRVQSKAYDRVIDYESMVTNGEKVYSFGSNDIVTDDQLKKLGDYEAKRRGSRRHVYSVQFKGTRYDIRSGRWYRLQIGGAGESEYIDAVVECIMVETTREAGRAPSTHVAFREVYEAWKYNSSAIVRYMVSGDPRALIGMSDAIVVGANTFTREAGMFCDGTDDHVEINLAINAMYQRGGGIVHLCEGTYYITAAIEMKSNVTLEGEGAGTIIEKNCDDYAIEAVGGSGTELTGIVIRNLSVTRNSSDTNSKEIVYASYCDDSVIADVRIIDSYYYGMSVLNSDRFTIRACVLHDCSVCPILVATCQGLSILDTEVEGSDGSVTYGVYAGGASESMLVNGLRITNMSNCINALYVIASNVSISNIVIDSIAQDTAANMHGVFASGNNMAISNISVTDVDNSDTPANSYGMKIEGDDNVLSSIYVEGCSGTGIYISGDETMIAGCRVTNNGTDYTDAGTNTATAAFSDT